MAILNGSLPNADEVMAVFVNMFQDTAQLIYETDSDGLTLTPSFNNIKYDRLSNNTYIDSTNSDIKDVSVFGSIILDEHNDASIDSSIWTTVVNNPTNGSAGVSESGGSLNLSAIDQGSGGHNAYAIADKASAPDLRNSNSNSVLFIKVNSIGTTATNVIYLSDGSIDVDMGITSAGTYRIEINPIGNTATVYANNDLNGTGSSSSKDISSLGNAIPWRVKFYVAGGSFATGSLSIDFERYLLNGSITKNFISTATTSGSTITNAVINIITTDAVSGTSKVIYLSADNGAHYETVTNNTFHRFTNTGTQLKLKVALQSDGSKVDRIDRYAIKYNFY
jgi:hypothetical protein